jgi:hypothetical protein
MNGGSKHRCSFWGLTLGASKSKGRKLYESLARVTRSSKRYVDEGLGGQGQAVEQVVEKAADDETDGEAEGERGGLAEASDRSDPWGQIHGDASWRM